MLRGIANSKGKLVKIMGQRQWVLLVGTEQIRILACKIGWSEHPSAFVKVVEG
jgi:hypothetical protein